MHYIDTNQIVDSIEAHEVDCNIAEVESYSKGYSAACKVVTDDKSMNRLGTIEHYISMNDDNDSYSKGWKDGIIEIFYEIS